MIQPLLIASVAGLALSVGAYFFGRHDGARLEEAKQIRAEERVRESEAAMQRVAAEAIATIEVTNKTIRTEVEREVREKPIYRDICIADPGILQSINAAKGIESAGDSVLPGTAAVN